MLYTNNWPRESKSCADINGQFLMIVILHATTLQNSQNKQKFQASIFSEVVNFSLAIYLSIIVEVRVEAHCVVASGFQIDVGGRVGVVLREVHIKLKCSVGIWRVRGSCDQDL